MTHPCEMFAAETVAGLREAQFDGPVENNAPLAPNVYFNWDDDEGAVEIAAASEPGALLSAAIGVSRAPRWLSLNVALGPGAFQSGDVLGLVVEADAGTDAVLPAFIRSAAGGERADTDLQDRLALTGERAVLTLLHTVDATDGLARIDGYHTLVLPLPSSRLELRLRDLRLFVLGAGRGLRSTPVQLSSYG